MSNDSIIAKRALEMVEETLDSRERQIINRVCQQLNKGETLPPEQAVQEWQSLHANRRLKKALLTRQTESD